MSSADPSATTSAAPTRRSGAVTIAGVLVIGVNAGCALISLVGTVVTAVLATGPPPDDHHTATNAPAIVFLICSVIALVLSVAGIALGARVLQRRSWARWVAVALFSVYGVAAGLLLVFGGRDPTFGTTSALVMGGVPLAVCVAIVSLLLTPAAFEDFDAVTATDV
ncbi:MAG: hypothetical protein LC789_18295 [Actinobacteria bacterium]|nr:hypothetical protein [Actinomycetota bacterium]MCA1722617.1 hypothetical protein [Actinomycetota bacterium]